MCKAKSFLCVQGTTDPVWSGRTDSHEKLKEELRIKDTDLFRRDCVAVELFPKSGWFDPKTEWEFKVDEPSTAPARFEEEKQLWHDRCWWVIEEKIIPALARGEFMGDLHLYSSAKLDALKSVGGDLYLYSSAKLDVAKLESVGGKP